MNPRRDSKITSPQPEVLVAEGLQKSYDNRHALQGLTLTLRAGRILGFLGPNGAGKTTSIRILTTMIAPDSGHFTVDGISSDHPQEIRRRIGVLPENLGFPRQMTGMEYLTFFGQLFGRSAANARETAKALLEDVGMTQRAKSLIGSYSHGMKQRIGIARSLINDPVVVFLDEPTLGLDPRGQQELLELIQRIARERGTGIILCSHLLSEIENVCDDVVILNQGQIVARGTVAEVIGRTRQNIVLKNSMRIQVPPDYVTNAKQALKTTMPNVIKVSSINETEGWIRAELVDAANGNSDKTYLINNSILSSLIRAKIPILSFAVEGGKLQDVFLHLTEETIR